MDKNKFVIVGAGAIGRLFGTLLSIGKQKVTFVEPQKEVISAINEQGIGILEMGGEDVYNIPFYPAKAVKNAQSIQSCDYILLAVKSYDTLRAMQSIAHLVSANSPVITIQTGLGNIEVMEKIVPRNNIIAGYTFLAGTALGPGIVRQGGVGKTYLGELDGKKTARIEKLCTIFNSSHMQTEIVKQIVGRIWCKVLVYSAINPVSAILRVSNGRLLEKMESITLMKRLIDEGKEVAAACAIDLVYHDLYDILFETCKQTYNNLSPMLQDILNEKRTEIDNLNSALCRYGAEHGVRVPTHHTIIQIIKLLEKWGPFTQNP